jgi:hypothetical protein
MPFRQRSPSELAVFVSSEALTGSGLREVVVAAIALGGADAKAQVAERRCRDDCQFFPMIFQSLPVLLEWRATRAWSQSGKSCAGCLNRWTCLSRRVSVAPLPSVAPWIHENSLLIEHP